MIGTTGATVLAIVNILFAGILGIVVGGISCATLRQRWSFQAVGIDAVLAMIVFFIAVTAISEIQIRLTHWADALTPGWILAAVAVIAGHLVHRH
jgi:tetrahydromethanopterin S-methyltransferase subunit D